MHRDCLKVSVNIGFIIYRYQWPYVASGFTVFLTLFLLFFISDVVQQYLAHSRFIAGSGTYSITAFLLHLRQILYPKQITLWLLVMSIAHFIFFKVRTNMILINVYIWSSHINCCMIIFLLKALVVQGNSSLHHSPLTFSFCLIYTAGRGNNFHHRNNNSRDWLGSYFIRTVIKTCADFALRKKEKVYVINMTRKKTTRERYAYAAILHPLFFLNLNEIVEAEHFMSEN